MKTQKPKHWFEEPIMKQRTQESNLRIPHIQNVSWQPNIAFPNLKTIQNPILSTMKSHYQNLDRNYAK